jgi:plastocyanin
LEPGCNALPPQTINGPGMKLRSFLKWLIALTIMVATAAALHPLVELARAQVAISQKGRQFQPADVTIARGQSIVIVNDDGDLLHHAYVDSDAFKFDSGDQKPGSRTEVTFSTAGDFDVLCAIHPKMKLSVHVK